MSDEVVSTIDSLRDDLARLGVAPGDLLMAEPQPAICHRPMRLPSESLK